MIPDAVCLADLARELIEAGLIKTVALGVDGLNHFEQLVVGSAIDTLDDKEAATLAYALEVGGSPIIDERKASRICAARFKALEAATSVDLFAHEAVEKALGRAALAEAVFLALRDARMRVFPDHVDWVITLIGADRARQCPSLPRAARSLPETRVSQITHAAVPLHSADQAVCAEALWGSRASARRDSAIDAVVGLPSAVLRSRTRCPRCRGFAVPA